MMDELYPVLEAIWAECSVINVILFTLIVILVKQLFTPSPSITAVDLPPDVRITYLYSRSSTFGLSVFSGYCSVIETDARCPACPTVQPLQVQIPVRE